MKGKQYLILEKSSDVSDIRVKRNKNFKKQLSPLRYPGGKSKMIDYLYQYVDRRNTKILVEPFSGGSSFSLSLLEAGVVDSIVINDIDYGVYSLFQTIITNPIFLIDKIKNTHLSHEDYYNSQIVINNSYEGLSIEDSAWIYLINNRLAYSGIYSANPLGGKNGDMKSLLVRYNPDTLIKRIKKIYELKDKITVLNEDALKVIKDYSKKENITFFIDPPYIKKGEAIYKHYYEKNDHLELCSTINTAYNDSKRVDYIITYDYHDELIDMYYNADVKLVNRIYSI